MNTLSAMLFFRLALSVMLGGALLPLVAWRNNRLANALGTTGSIAGALFGLTASLSVLLDPAIEDYRFTIVTSWFDFSLKLDGLAVFFTAPVMLLIICAAIYAFRYLDLPTRGLQAARHWFSFNMLGLSMMMVLTAANSLFFLVSWELMSLSSFLLVINDLEDDQARQAGWTYLVATHMGTALLLFMFMQEYQLTGSLDFTPFSILKTLPTGGVLLFFFLGLAGFGIKAGLFPFHVWLPEAHSAAPSHVSALMSGVMTKTAIYAFLRLVTFLPPLPAWCGLTVAVLGIIGGLFGIAMASMQTDIKRTLAYSTVENIGIIFLGLGTWLYCRSAGLQTPAILILMGTLLHIWNHSLFKGLLFMGAGSIIHGAKTREMSSMGGLLRRMPVTGSLMIMGSASIAALPPMNGLVGELLIYLGLLFACQTLSGGMAFVFMLFAILFAIIGAMALLTMTRLIGISLGGEPRSSASSQAHESSGFMLTAMIIPAIFCLFIGIFPQALLLMTKTPLAVLAPDTLAIFTLTASTLPFGPLWSITSLALLVFLAFAFTNRSLLGQGLDRVPTWGCGFARQDSCLEYSAGSFSQYAQDGIYCSCLQPPLTRSSKPLLFPAAMYFLQRNIDPVLTRFFSPFFVKCAVFASACRRLQAGRLGIYLLYFFLTTILLLGWATYSSPG